MAAPITPADTDAALPLLLVVEDNRDLRLHIMQCLGSDYRFIEAEDGQQGWEQAREQLPDLLISDLVMPEKDGLELCRLIKSTESTSHIPFIMLTAKATQKGKIEGLETGADDYIFKPFEGKELYLKTRNLLEQRRKLQDKLQNELLLHPIPSDQLSQDQKFMRKVRDLIEKHMNDPKLNVTYLSHELGLSRTQAYRKVSALCGLSVTELIRNMRTKKAANLLEQNWGTVSDVGYEVGFNNLSYFAKCFKESYGRTPSEYLQLKKTESSGTLGK
ncbi:MAG: response regulator [Cyclobacteriaceae bacterium]